MESQPQNPEFRNNYVNGLKTYQMDLPTPPYPHFCPSYGSSLDVSVCVEDEDQ